jgi:hypothetical protein
MNLHAVFVESEAALGVGFRTALSRLASVTDGSIIERASADAYREAVSALGGFSPPIPGADPPVLARFHSHEVMIREDSAQLAFRWEASMRGSGRYPALDADITLTPAGADATLVHLVGVYRLPSAALADAADPADPAGRSAAHAVVAGTAEVLLSRVARAITGPAGPTP